MAVPLTEKYRPARLNDINGNNEVMECLKSFSLSDLPNLLFYGPPGTGKTTAIRALIADLPRQNVMELNASDSRGIDTVRVQIKEFAQTKTALVKVVVLDEADSMSRDAQSALRRIMEDHENTRFCLICNYARKILPPIASRCTRFRFCPVNETGRIREVCLKEGIRFTDDGIELINEYSDGDMRKVMNDIQGMHGAYPLINRPNVLEFFRICDEKGYSVIFESLCTDNFKACMAVISKYDVDCVSIIGGILDLIIASDLKNKMLIITELAAIEKRLAQGCSETLQLKAVVGTFILNR